MEFTDSRIYRIRSLTHCVTNNITTINKTPRANLETTVKPV